MGYAVQKAWLYGLRTKAKTKYSYGDTAKGPKNVYVNPPFFV